mgnify:CR=1
KRLREFESQIKDKELSVEKIWWQ